MHRLTPQDVDGRWDKKGIGSVPVPFGAGAYTASDKALRGKSGLVHETSEKGLITKEHIVKHMHLNFVFKRVTHYSTLAISLFNSSRKL